MGKQEHRVSVEGGKYTFVVPADDYRVSILRYGEPWHGPQGEASNALCQIMMELDAARVVVQAFRELVAPDRSPRSTREGFNRITDALARHDALVGDREPPSTWCGGTEYAERAATTDQQATESRSACQAFKDIDTAATVKDLEALMRSLAGKLGYTDNEDALRRYYQRKAWLETQAVTP